ncbi:MAG: DsbA family protein, partial [Planctomycetota bacterium]
DAFRRTLERAAGELGFETPALVAAMQDPAAGAAIAEDAQAGKRLGARFIPWVYVNNRWVPRWSLTGHDIVGQILDAAGSDD